jgi:hypothetical protein
MVARLKILLVALVAPSLGCLAQDATWDGKTTPITIEVSRDVPVRASERQPDGSMKQQRGSLYSSREVLIAAGQRFKVTQLLGEGACRIEYGGQSYALSSCPWMPGFRDPQADIFKIVGVGSGK